MQQEQKQQIITAATAYLTEKGLTNAELARLSGINQGYMSNMLRGNFTTTVSGKPVEIADKWFIKLAETVCYKVEKTYWEPIMTTQFMQIISILEHAKQNGTSGMIIGATGCGKTYAVDKFVNKHPQHTYRVTVSNLHTLPHILEDLLGKLNLAEKGRAANKLARIVNHLQWLKRNGERVIIIIDEAENMTAHVIRMIKALYDGILNFCSIILIGTPELTDKLERMKRKDRDGIPQFCRRFKAGTRHLSQIGDMDMFLDKYVSDKGLRKLLSALCENYGELHDYLMPVIREADNTGKPLTEELFRLYHNLPNY